MKVKDKRVTTEKDKRMKAAKDKRSKGGKHKIMKADKKIMAQSQQKEMCVKHDKMSESAFVRQVLAAPAAMGAEDVDEHGSDDDEAMPQEDHKEMLSSIKSITKSGSNRGQQRTETAASEVSEFSLKPANDEKIHLGDLLGSVKEKSSKTLSSKLRRVRNKKQLLQSPIEKPQHDRIQRTLTYEKTKEELAKWDKIVEVNRKADQLVFPLNDDKLSLHTSQEVMSRFKPRTTLEKEITLLLHGQKGLEEGVTIMTKRDEDAKRAMDLHEARELRREMQKTRAQLSYRIAKAKRQNSIKSKKFRRIVRKEKEKAKLKEVENLALTDPEQAAVEMEKIEKMRIMERAALRHRQPGKWARELLKHSKYDPAAREAIQDQIQKGKELLDKRKQQVIVMQEKGDEEESSDYEDEELMEENVPVDVLSATNNPWLGSNQTSEEKSGEAVVKSVRFDVISQPLLNEGREKRQTLKDLDSLVNDATEDSPVTEVTGDKAPRVVRVYPDKHVTVNSRVLTADRPDFSMAGDIDDDDDDEDKQRKIIAEAFADDDVVANFDSEKKSVRERNKVNPVDLSLPGWGSWAGEGIQPSKRKTRRFFVRPPPAPPRRDKNLKNVIINELKDAKVAEHQVKQLPYQFTSVDQFQNSIKAPVGKTWNTETAFRELTKPKIVTKLGKIIRPLSAEEAIAKDDGKDGDSLKNTALLQNKRRKRRHRSSK